MRQELCGWQAGLLLLVSTLCRTRLPAETLNHRRQKYLQRLASNSRRALPLLHFPVPSRTGQTWDVPVRHDQAFPTERSFAERLVSSPCTTMLTYSQEAYVVLNPRRTPRSTAGVTTACSSLQLSQHRHTFISAGISRGYVAH